MIVLAVVPLSSVSPAAEASLREELERSFQEARKAFSREVDRMLEEGTRALAERLARSFEARIQTLEGRISALEAEIQKRDARIAELEAMVRKLGGELPAPPKPSVAKPGPERPRGKAFLGVRHASVPLALQESLEIRGGAIVTEVVPDSPAARADLRRGDILVKIGDTEISSETLSEAMAALQPGDEIEVTYFRDGERRTARLRLEAREAFVAPAEAPEAPRAEEPIVLGIELTEGEGELTVEKVEPGLTGSVAGLEVGDRIVEISGRTVRSLEDVVSALSALRAGQEFAIAFVRGPYRYEVRVVGARDRGAVLISKKIVRLAPEQKPLESAKPAPGEKPAALGVEIVVSDEAGAAVVAVLPGSAAEKAGIRTGDVIRRVGDRDVTGASLREAVSKYKAGEKAKLVVSRDGATLEVEVVFSDPGILQGSVASPPPQPAKAVAEKPRPPGRLGLTAIQSSDDVVAVKLVLAGSPAARAGLEAGDIVVAANGREVRTLDDLAAALKGLSAGDKVKLRVRRGEEIREVEVELGELTGDKSSP